jgi:hypothetical protein
MEINNISGSTNQLNFMQKPVSGSEGQRELQNMREIENSSNDILSDFKNKAGIGSSVDVLG